MKSKPLCAGLLLAVGSAYADCARFQSDDDVGLLQDRSTGLTWTRCVVGQTGNPCVGSPATLSWVDALNRARASQQGGISHWRLPKIDELRESGACLETLVPALVSVRVWSASANLDYATDAWAYHFTDLKSVVYARDHPLAVILVTGP